MVMWGFWLTGAGLFLWVIRLSFARRVSATGDGMVCSMSVGTAAGTGVGVYAPLAMGTPFLPAALAAFAVGCLAGWAVGWRSGIRGVLEGTVAGWMGGTMGAMTATMIPPETEPVLFRVTGVLVAGIQFMVFLILSVRKGVSDGRESLLYNPWAYFLLTAGFLLSLHFHPLESVRGAVHGG